MVSLKQCTNMTNRVLQKQFTNHRDNLHLMKFEIKLHLDIIMTSGFVKKGQQQQLLFKCTIK